MFKKRPKGIDLFAAVLFVLGCSGLIYRSVQPSQLLSSAVGFLDKTYTLFILMASILCILSAVLLLLGKNIGRLGYYFLVPVFIGIFLWDQIQEIMEPPFHPEQFFFLNLMTILGQSLIPIILFGILVYFLRRPQANAFFSNQPWVSQEITDNAPSETYFQTLSEWTDFNGRIGVGAFWRFYIINLFLCLVPMIATAILISRQSPGAPDVGPIPFLFVLFIPIFTLAAAVRRLHDTGRSGWYLLLFGVLPIGPLILLVLLSLTSKPPKN